MSDLVPHKKAIHRQGRLRRFRGFPDLIRYEPDRGTEIQFTDGSQGRGTCLGCHDAPCMVMAESQLNLDGIVGMFPGDPSRDVCPTEAIDWDEAVVVPTIDAGKCIGCGLCAIRCPYGAIVLSPQGVALVESGDPDGITTTETDSVESHMLIPRLGMLGSLATHFMHDMPRTIAKLTDIQGTLLVRNMLAVCGVAASMRRKGDTNIRMDGLFRFSSGKIAVVEIEFGTDVMELPRALLEDIAVLHSRFGVPIGNIVPVSIIGTLPNVRTEYYQVIDDILKVLGIQCRTLTFGVLCMLMWHFKKLDGLEREYFITKSDSTNLHTSLAQLIPDLSIEEPYPGAFTPSK